MSAADLANKLYYGDNLDILRAFPDECVDLVYLDPPFNSKLPYNLIFRSDGARQFDSQLETFLDTWHWGPKAESHYAYLTNSARNGGRVPSGVSQIIAALRAGLGANDVTAYIVEMSIRLVEMHRVLRPTGSLWLHCDPTVSHYLKVMLDAIFGARSFRNEVVWKRTSAHSDARQGANRLGRVHDTLLFYGKSDQTTWNVRYLPYSDEHTTSKYRRVEPGSGRRYTDSDLTARKPGGDTSYEWQGVRPPEGRYWAYSRANMEAFERDGRLLYTRNGFPRYKRYLDEMPGTPLQDVWTDISPVNAMARERVGFDTQKPVALIERIFEVASNRGDIVLDPFCGCGTSVVAAKKLARGWIGIDKTYLAIGVIQARVRELFGIEVPIEGSPTEVEGARKLAQQTPNGREQFELWALTLVGAMPQGGIQKKGADQGVDGVITFTGAGGALASVIVSVKSGHAQAAHVQQLKGAMDRFGAAIGLFVTLEEPSGPMKHEAAVAGMYHSDVSGSDYARVQILSISDLLEKRRKPDLPPLLEAPYRDTIWSDDEVPTVPRDRRRPRRQVPAAASKRGPQDVPASSLAGRVRDDYADASPEAPRSPRKSKRDRPVPLPSQE